jgi:response regulator of citrate/malate metabolism
VSRQRSVDHKRNNLFHRLKIQIIKITIASKTNTMKQQFCICVKLKISHYLVESLKCRNFPHPLYNLRNARQVLKNDKKERILTNSTKQECTHCISFWKTTS